MWRLIKKRLSTPIATLAREDLQLSGEPSMMQTEESSVGTGVRQKVYGGSLHLRHVDCGSCNACEWELQALLNPVYDLQRFGMDFVASPRHADALVVTGGLTVNLLEALQVTYAATASPKLVVAVGDCTLNGGLAGANYAQSGGIEGVVPVAVKIPGCPPTPADILRGLLKALEIWEKGEDGSEA